jgi:hypothetical protein
MSNEGSPPFCGVMYRIGSHSMSQFGPAPEHESRASFSGKFGEDVSACHAAYVGCDLRQPKLHRPVEHCHRPALRGASTRDAATTMAHPPTAQIGARMMNGTASFMPRIDMIGPNRTETALQEQPYSPTRDSGRAGKRIQREGVGKKVDVALVCLSDLSNRIKQAANSGDSSCGRSYSDRNCFPISFCIARCNKAVHLSKAFFVCLSDGRSDKKGRPSCRPPVVGSTLQPTGR